MRTILTKERKLPARPANRTLRRVFLTAAAAVASLLVCGQLSPSPRFVLGGSADHITFNNYQPLRRASDWVSNRKYAVLTFDDGPEGNGVDEQILSVLRRHHAHAIFFVVCNHLDDDTSRIVNQFEREGHLIGNHSFDHLELNHVTPAQLNHQIEDCSRQLANVTGHRPRYFRPPFGMTSGNVALAAKKSGMRQVLWNANSYDDFTRIPSEIVHHASVQTDDASIILMHEKAVTASVLDRILTDLEGRGFNFVLPDDELPSDSLG